MLWIGNVCVSSHSYCKTICLKEWLGKKFKIARQDRSWFSFEGRRKYRKIGSRSHIEKVLEKICTDRIIVRDCSFASNWQTYFANLHLNLLAFVSSWKPNCSLWSRHNFWLGWEANKVYQMWRKYAIYIHIVYVEDISLDLQSAHIEKH